MDMKKTFIGFGMAAVLLMTVAFLTEQGNGIFVRNNKNEPKLLIQVDGAQTQPVICIQNAAGVGLWQVSSNGTQSSTYGGSSGAAGARAGLGIQSGTAITTTDGTVTNAFDVVFSAVPVVVTAQRGTTLSLTNWITSITTSNFVVRSGAGPVTNSYIAVGTP